jgi:UDP-N-acetylglucosamine--N-acetylmuramyl-(pentapeptide) pyrophosphoryl-undecaprenol N-acetylglucosamine transferase
VTPALALAEEITRRGDRLLVVGSERGLEARLVPEAGFELLALPSKQVMGRSLLGRVAGVFGILAQLRRARAALRRVRADVVVSVGGYAAMPAALAAILTRTPLALVEPNAIPGRVNRLTARFAQRVFVGFDEAARRLSTRGDSTRVQRVGIPLRAGLVAAFRSAPPRKPPGCPLHLLVFGGSQGARQINEAMMEILPRLAPDRVEVFHQAGELDFERVEKAYAATSLHARVVRFEPDMPARYAWADLAVCRAGALTVAELALAGLPALLIPLPHAADDHQTANARALASAGAARCLPARPLDPEELLRAIERACEAPDELARMSSAATGLARPDAARRVVEECARLATEAGR